jgi:hypothetical protein
MSQGNVIGVLGERGMWCLIGHLGVCRLQQVCYEPAECDRCIRRARNVVLHKPFKDSVECSRSLTGQQNVIDVLRVCRMWLINSESAEFGIPFMTLRRVVAEIYYKPASKIIINL